MKNPIFSRTALELWFSSPGLRRINRLCCAVLPLAMAVLIAISQAQSQQPRPIGSEPIPEPAVPAILSGFEKYEVVGMPEAHGLKDVDDFILSLIRIPAFSEKVNDLGTGKDMVVVVDKSLYHSLRSKPRQ